MPHYTHTLTHTNMHRQRSIQSCSSASSLCCATIARCPPFVVFIYLRRLIAIEGFIYCLVVSAIARLHSEETCQLSFSRTGRQPCLQPFRACAGVLSRDRLNPQPELNISEGNGASSWGRGGMNYSRLNFSGDPVEEMKALCIIRRHRETYERVTVDR